MPTPTPHFELRTTEHGNAEIEYVDGVFRFLFVTLYPEPLGAQLTHYVKLLSLPVKAPPDAPPKPAFKIGRHVVGYAD